MIKFFFFLASSFERNGAIEFQKEQLKKQTNNQTNPPTKNPIFYHHPQTSELRHPRETTLLMIAQDNNNKSNKNRWRGCLV